MNKENKETSVLGIINHGNSKFGKISREARVEPKELELILQRLEDSGWIRVEKKKGWISKIFSINSLLSI